MATEETAIDQDRRGGRSLGVVFQGYVQALSRFRASAQSDSSSVPVTKTIQGVLGGEASKDRTHFFKLHGAAGGRIGKKKIIF